MTDVARTEGAGLHWFVHLTERERSEYVWNRAWYRQYDAVAYVLSVSKLYTGSLLWSCKPGKNQPHYKWNLFAFLYFTYNGIDL